MTAMKTTSPSRSGISPLCVVCKLAKPARAVFVRTRQRLDSLYGELVSVEPFFVFATVQNTGHEGLSDLEFRLGNEAIEALPP